MVVDAAPADTAIAPPSGEATPDTVSVNWMVPAAAAGSTAAETVTGRPTTADPAGDTVTATVVAVPVTV